MVRMAARYGHFAREDLRSPVESIRRPGIQGGSPVNPPGIGEIKTMTEYIGAIEKQTLENTYFRQVLFTAQHAQLVVMCLRLGEEIGDEVHPNVDQFFRIEQGEAKFAFNEKVERPVHDGDASWFRQGRTTT